MERELYLVRHGRTMFNEKGIIQGWCDSPLTEIGKNQAQHVGSYFKAQGVEFDAAYASPAGRTRETIECITSMPYTCDAGLRELFFGTFEGEHETVLVKPFTDEMFVPFGGESLSQLMERMNDTLFKIMAREGHGCVLVVSHGTASEMFLRKWEAFKSCDFTGMPGNCSVMRFTFDGTSFSLKDVLTQDDLVFFSCD